MKNIRVVFENISGGLIYAGNSYGEMLFSRVSIKEYISYFRSLQADVLSLVEVHLDDDKDNSKMVRNIAKELNLDYYVSFTHSESHLDTSKYLGTAIISRFPVLSSEKYFLPKPDLEVNRKDGSKWLIADKGIQNVIVEIDGMPLVVFNLHYFPFHHFGRKMNEEHFSNIREALANLLFTEGNIPTIVTGDFNNKGLPLNEAFPELFIQSKLKEALIAETTVVGYQEQLDHILYTPKHLEVNEAFSERNFSDHYALTVGFSLLTAC